MSFDINIAKIRNLSSHPSSSSSSAFSAAHQQRVDVEPVATLAVVKSSNSEKEHHFRRCVAVLLAGESIKLRRRG